MNEDQTPNGEVNDGNGSGDQDQKVTIGGVEMTVAEAQELIESGKTMKELRTQYPNVDFKEMPKAFTQANQKLAELEKLNKKEDSGKTLNADEEKRRAEIQEFFQDPLVREELEKITNQKEAALREDLAFNKALEELEGKYDGKNGLPKFDRREVLKYGQENNIFNPEVAYKQMYETEIDEWKIKSKLDRRSKGTFFEKQRGGGGDAPPTKAPPKDFNEALKATMAAAEAED